MTPDQMRREIDNFSIRLLESDLALDYNIAQIRRRQDRIFVGWTGGTEEIVFSDLEFATIQEYYTHLEHRNFTLLLVDGSFLQISYEFEHGEIINHRLAYYPCPFLLDIDEAREFGVLESLQAISSESILRRTLLRSPMRFDFDPFNATEDHPDCHIHLSHENCRIPVFAPIDLSSFIEFIFKNFYNDMWKDFAVFRNLQRHSYSRCIQNHHLSSLHFHAIYS